MNSSSKVLALLASVLLFGCSQPTPLTVQVQPSAIVVAEPVIGSQDRPVPIGDAYVGPSAIFTVTYVKRGVQARKIVYEANSFNEAPADALDPGYEFVIVTVHVLAVDATVVRGSSFSVVEHGSVVELSPWTVVMPGKRDLSLLSGGEDDLTIVFEFEWQPGVNGSGNKIVLLLDSVFFSLTP